MWILSKLYPGMGVVVKYQVITFGTHCHLMNNEFCERYIILTEGGELYKKLKERR